MSISTELTRITNDRNTIRNKLVNLGLAQSADKLDALATAIGNIANRGTPSATVKEGESYTIEPGYYAGGSVSGVAGGGNYTLQTKEVSPTKQQQSVSPDAGYYGLSSVTVNAIPANFNDTSAVTAGASDVLANKTIVNASGETVPGTMPNNGAVSRTLDATTGNQSYTIPAGYHNGLGTVTITLEEKSATPSGATQTIAPSAGKVLGKVTIDPIPAIYGDATGADATASNILAGKSAVVNISGTATLVAGGMTDNGAISATIDGISTTSYSVPAGYTSGGTVSLTDDIESSLSLI